MNSQLGIPKASTTVRRSQKSAYKTIHFSGAVGNHSGVNISLGFQSYHMLCIYIYINISTYTQCIHDIVYTSTVPCRPCVAPFELSQDITMGSSQLEPKSLMREGPPLSISISGFERGVLTDETKPKLQNASKMRYGVLAFFFGAARCRRFIFLHTHLGFQDRELRRDRCGRGLCRSLSDGWRHRRGSGCRSGGEDQ